MDVPLKQLDEAELILSGVFDFRLCVCVCVCGCGRLPESSHVGPPPHGGNRNANWLRMTHGASYSTLQQTSV